MVLRNFGILLIHHIGIILGMITIITWTAFGIERKRLKCNAFLAGSSFFIYAYHGYPIAFLVKYWVILIQPPTELTMIMGYLIIPIIIVILGIGIYALMKKCLPKFTALITGGR